GGGAARAGANSHYRVLDELYPYEPQYAQLLRAGVTTLGLVPEGRGINGQGMVIRPQGETPQKMALQDTSPFAISFAQDTQTQDLIRQTLQSGGTSVPAGGGGFGGGGGFRGGRRGGRDADEAEQEDDPLQRGQRRRPTGGGGFAPAALTEVSA